MMHFEVELQSGGTMLHKARHVKATESGVVGCYVNGKPYLPDLESVKAAMPYCYRKAIERGLWWDFGLSDVVRLDLYRKRDGKPLGSLFAQLVSN